MIPPAKGTNVFALQSTEHFSSNASAFPGVPRLVFRHPNEFVHAHLFGLDVDLAKTAAHESQNAYFLTPSTSVCEASRPAAPSKAAQLQGISALIAALPTLLK